MSQKQEKRTEIFEILIDGISRNSKYFWRAYGGVRYGTRGLWLCLRMMAKLSGLIMALRWRVLSSTLALVTIEPLRSRRWRRILVFAVFIEPPRAVAQLLIGSSEDGEGDDEAKEPRTFHDHLVALWREKPAEGESLEPFVERIQTSIELLGIIGDAAFMRATVFENLGKLIRPTLMGQQFLLEVTMVQLQYLSRLIFIEFFISKKFRRVIWTKLASLAGRQ